MTSGDILRAADDLYVDPETGELVEWVTDIDAELLMSEHREAAEQEAAWKSRKQMYSRALERVLDSQGARSFIGDEFSARYYSGGAPRSATANRLREALQWAVINREQYDAIVETAMRDLDPDAIEELVEAAVITTEQRDYIVTRTPRGGYVRTTRLLKDEPKRAQRRRDDYEGAA